MSAAKATTDHSIIRGWVEARGGHPAKVRGTGRGDADRGDAGILRIDYPGYRGEGTLEEISWDDFFTAFDANELAFLYQEDDDSRFSKLVHRDTVEDEAEDDDDEYEAEEAELADEEDEDEQS